MRFEEYFKQQIVQWLNSLLQESVTESGVVVTYDPTIANNTETLANPLYENSQAYGVCVKNTTIVRSNLSDIDFNTITFMVESVMDENKTQKFLNATESIAKTYDSVLQSFNETDDSTTPSTTITTQYKCAFGVAYVSRPRYALHCLDKTIKANTISWIITVQYTTSSIFLTRRTLSIKVGNTTYNLTNILDYSMSGQLTARDVQQIETTRVTSHALNYLNVYTFNIRKTTSAQGLNKALADACADASTFTLSQITIDSQTYSVKKFMVTEIWRDNVGAYQLIIYR